MIKVEWWGPLCTKWDGPIEGRPDKAGYARSLAENGSLAWSSPWLPPDVRQL